MSGVDRRAPSRTSGRRNPEGNERLTAAAGIVLVVLTLIELASLLLGLQTFMSLHVFVGLALIPPVLLKLGSTGWRFLHYYARNRAYRLKGAPQLAMRLLAPVIVAATVVLFASGVAMGFLHGSALQQARNLHGPASVVWLIGIGIHVLVYLKRALSDAARDLFPRTRAAVRGARPRTLLLLAAVAAGLVAGVATVPLQHRWENLPRLQDHRDGLAAHAPARGELRPPR